MITMDKCFDTQKIRDTVRKMQGERRYSHTLGVEEEAYALGMIFMPEKCEKLALTALLHDITKKKIENIIKNKLKILLNIYTSKTVDFVVII